VLQFRGETSKAFNVENRHGAGYMKLTQMPRLEFMYRAFVMMKDKGKHISAMTQDLRVLRGRKQSEIARCIEAARAVYCFAMVIPDPAPRNVTASQAFNGAMTQTNKAEHTVHGMVLYYPNKGGQDTRPRKISGPLNVIERKKGQNLPRGTPARSGRLSSSSSGARSGTRSSSSSSSSSSMRPAPREEEEEDEEDDDEEDDREEEPDFEEVDPSLDLPTRNVEMLWESRYARQSEPSSRISRFTFRPCRPRQQIRPEIKSQQTAVLSRGEVLR